jgi:hypothetical protein
MEQRNDLGRFAGAVALSALVTAAYSWTAVALGWLLGGVISMAWRARPKNPALGAVASVAVVAWCAALSGRTGTDGSAWVPTALLLLLWYGLGRGKVRGAANVLGLLMVPLVAALFFGLGDVDWAENLPELPQWRQVLTSALVALLCWGPGTEPGGWQIASGGVAVGFSLMTRGILGRALAGATALPLYRAVETIRILGVVQRLEALVAAAVLMGLFALMLRAGTWGNESLERLFPEAPEVWRRSGLVLGAAAVVWCSQLWGAGIAAFWGLLVGFTLWLVLFQKIRKN